MTRFRIVCGVAVVGTTMLLAPVARAVPDPTGTLCAFTAVNVTGTSSTGELDAGPIVIDPDDPTGTHTGLVTCAVQVGSATYGDSTNDTASASASGIDVLYLSPRLVTYLATPTVPVYVCTTVTVTDGEPPYVSQYYDAATGTWSQDPDTARCPTAQRVNGNGGGGGPGGNGQAAIHRNAHAKVVDGGGSTPLTPFYPAGTIEISAPPVGPITYFFHDFDPPVETWSCPISGTSVTCTPPAPAAGFRNVCGELSANAESTSLGVVNGRSACSASEASATSTGPTTTPSNSSQRADATFPWTCSAAPAGSIIWKVTCAVGP